MRPITLLTDYGIVDDFVGVCHAVIAARAPGAQVIDLTHGVARHDVAGGAIVLRRALTFAPPGIHVAVVDPGVGGTRRAIAARCAEDERILVGPDNGLLALAAARFGGITDAVDISGSPHRLETVSATFHGRDIFAPVAAALAAGAPLREAGREIAPQSVLPLELPVAYRDGAALVAHAVAVDRYGNLSLNVTPDALLRAGLQLGAQLRVNDVPATYGLTFADVSEGTLLLYEDAYRTLALAVNRGDAGEALDVGVGDEIRITRP